MNGPYRLINELHAHSGPVRSMTQIQSIESQSITIATGCQADSPNTRLWNVVGKEIIEVGSVISHNHWVTALTSLRANILSTLPMALLITGCYDAIIRVFDAQTNFVLLSLSGHTKGIISFSWTVNNQLISGSWDGTARIWDVDHGGQIIHILEGHENGVHVLGLPSGIIVTTSTGEAVDNKPANFQIRFWDSLTGKRVGDSVKDHFGSIRSICSVPAIQGFATTSNDGTVAVRTRDGTSIALLVHPLSDDGIPPFVLDCTVLNNSTNLDLVSCGEDGSVIIWQDMSMFQSIPHPNCVWCVLPIVGNGYEGDFLTAGNDGVVRYFSRNPTLASLASSEQLTAQLLAEVEETRQKRHKGPSEEDLAKAPKWENREQHPGKSEGQVMLFNKFGSMIAAQWSVASRVWVEVGEVTSTQDGGEIDGVLYDHKFPVEIETSQGLINLQLGYNNGESPFVAAQRFINTNKLNQGYLSQIADWIAARAGRDSTPSLGTSNDSRHSSSSYTASDVILAISSYPHIVKAYVLFDDIPNGFATKVLRKLSEYNSTMTTNQISESDIIVLESLLKTLSQTSYYHASKVLPNQLLPIGTILSWEDYNKVFPAYDILRILAIHPSGSEVLATTSYSVLQKALTVFIANSTQPIDSVSTSMLLTSLRFLSNVFRNEILRMLFLRLTHPTTGNIIDSLSNHVLSKSKPVRITISTLLLNYSIAISSIKVYDNWMKESMQSYLKLIHQIMILEKEDPDILYNIVLGLGTIIGSMGRGGMEMIQSEVMTYAKSNGYDELLVQIKDFVGSEPLKAVVIEDLLKLLRSNE